MKTLEAKPFDQNAENWKRENWLFTSTVLEAGASGQNRIGTHAFRSHRTVWFIFAAQTFVSCYKQGAYGPWKPWKVLEFRKPFSRSWKGLENCKNQEDLWKDLEIWRDKLDFRLKQDPRFEQRGSLSNSLAKSRDRSTSGEGAGIEAWAGRAQGSTRRQRRCVDGSPVGVDWILRTSIAQRWNLNHGLAPANEGFELTVKMTRRAWSSSAFCLGPSWRLNIDLLHESLTRRRFADTSEWPEKHKDHSSTPRPTLADDWAQKPLHTSYFILHIF